MRESRTYGSVRGRAMKRTSLPLHCPPAFGRRLTHCRRKVRIDQCADQTDTGRKFAQQPQSLRLHQVRRRGDPSGVAARPIKALYEASLDRIASCRKYNWDCRGGLLGGFIGWVAADGRDHGYSAVDEFGGQRGETAIVAARPTKLKRNALAFNEAAILQATPKRFYQMCRLFGRPRTQESNDRQRLLRVHGDRPSRRAAEQRDELAAPHSITSSARASSVGGTSRPSALAVFRLMTSWNLTGA